MSKCKINQHEAVMGFATWLTCRETPVTFGARHDAAVAADLVNTFARANNLPDISERWPKHLIHPDDGEIATESEEKE